MILREGHRGQNFYMIFSGSVFINKTGINVKGEKFLNTEFVLKEGATFGASIFFTDFNFIQFFLDSILILYSFCEYND